MALGFPMLNDRPHFPSVIDASLISAWRSCHQKAFREYFQHWKLQGGSIHLHAGAAFARGLEVARSSFYEKGFDAEQAAYHGQLALVKSYGDFEPPPGSSKTLERMIGALDFYFESYPLATDAAKPHRFASGQHGIEFSFAQPFPVRHPITGDPLIYSGRCDMIVDYAGGIYLEDDKTTSQLGASWGRQWDLRSQFTGYCWAAGEAGIDVKGVLVRGISILKTKYDTLQAVTYRARWEIERWLTQTIRDVNNMILAWDTGYWDFALDHACDEYGGCSFKQICKSPEPEAWLPMYFERRVWNPLDRSEKPYAEVYPEEVPA